MTATTARRGENPFFSSQCFSTMKRIEIKPAQRTGPRIGEAAFIPARSITPHARTMRM